MQSLPILLRELLPEAFLIQAHKDAGVRRNNSVYAPLVILWLLMLQRLQAGASLEIAVFELLRGLPESFWPLPCKRVRDWRETGQAPSSHTGAYNQARQALPLSVVEQSCDRIFQQLVAKLDQSAPQEVVRAFLLDGSTVRMAHSEPLCKQYPPGSNQHGEGHWPLMRVVVAHDLRTGLGMRPEWGALNGENAVSEQELLERAIDRLPSGSTVIGDANFGVFSVAYTATQSEHPVLVRLTAQRARRLLGEQLRDGIDREVVWKPSRDDRKSHPDLPSEACVRGRVIVREVQPDNGRAPFLLPLFTTAALAEDVVSLYGRRWDIETDLRTLKSSLCLDQLTCLTPDMVAKEIEIGVAAYNLVRAMIALAALQSGIAPRDYSFTKVHRILQTFGPALADAPDPTAAKRIFDQMMRYVQQSKLFRRKRKRPPYPRAVWNRGAKFPIRRT